jgi:hypothetical protein
VGTVTLEVDPERPVEGHSHHRLGGAPAQRPGRHHLVGVVELQAGQVHEADGGGDDRFLVAAHVPQRGQGPAESVGPPGAHLVDEDVADRVGPLHVQPAQDPGGVQHQLGLPFLRQAGGVAVQADGEHAEAGTLLQEAGHPREAAQGPDPVDEDDDHRGQQRATVFGGRRLPEVQELEQLPHALVATGLVVADQRQRGARLRHPGVRDPPQPVEVVAGLRLGEHDELQLRRAAQGGQLAEEPAGHRPPGRRRPRYAEHAGPGQIHGHGHGGQHRGRGRVLTPSGDLDGRGPVGDPQAQREGVVVAVAALPQAPAGSGADGRHRRRVGKLEPGGGHLGGGGLGHPGLGRGPVGLVSDRLLARPAGVPAAVLLGVGEGQHRAHEGEEQELPSLEQVGGQD